jgi:methylmalonyl-CoA mutase
MKKLYSGFDLCAPSTSVSMTINGPAPMILALFMNTAIDQQVEKLSEGKRAMGSGAEADRRAFLRATSGRATHGDLPKGNDGLGLGPAGHDR